MTLMPVSNISQLGRLLVECRSMTVNGIALFVFDRAELVDRFADHVHHAAQRAASHGHGDRAALVDGLHAAHHAVGRLHGDAAHAAFAEVLLHFEDDVDGVGTLKPSLTTCNGLINRRQVPSANCTSTAGPAI